MTLREVNKSCEWIFLKITKAELKRAAWRPREAFRSDSARSAPDEGVAMLLGRLAGRAGAMVRHCGTSLRVPKAPPGTGEVFHAQTMLPKYSLTNQKWCFLFFMCNLGAYSGPTFKI